MWNMICFFQAEDCIRDGHVTGVQTCALPILVVHHSKVGLKDRLDHQLGNAFTALQVNGFCWVEIYQRNFDLPTITGINSSWGIHYTKPATYGKTRTGMDKTCKALGNSNGDTSRHQ